MNPSLLSSDRMDWRTPRDLLEDVRKVAPIGLDPCGHPDSFVNAKETYYWMDGRIGPLVTNDGLATSWRNKGLVFCNPPYGKELSKWTAKCKKEFGGGLPNGSQDQLILLVPSRTDTRWFQDDITDATMTCFLKGRLTFEGAPSCAPFPSLLAYWGQYPEIFAKHFESWGWIVG